MPTKKEIIAELKEMKVQFDDTAKAEDLQYLLDVAKGTKQNVNAESPLPVKTEVPKEPINVNLPGEVGEMVKKMMQDIEDLKAANTSKDKTIEMLKEVADKGRMFNYENSHTGKNKSMKVKLSVFRGQIIVGWKTNKDELVKHPTTGKTVGEIQEYEILLLDKEGKITSTIVNGYPTFTDARYTERIECEVVGKKEDFAGNLEFDVQIPEFGKQTIHSRFVN